jgi:hypothetical protein
MKVKRRRLKSLSSISRSAVADMKVPEPLGAIYL